MGGNEFPLGLRKQNGGDSLRKCKLAPLSIERFHHSRKARFFKADFPNRLDNRALRLPDSLALWLRFQRGHQSRDLRLQSFDLARKTGSILPRRRRFLLRVVPLVA